MRSARSLRGSRRGGSKRLRDHSDDILVMSMEYDSAGNVATQTNPGGVTTCLEYDAVGRQLKQIMNCIDASSSSSSSSSSSGAPETDDVCYGPDSLSVMTG